MNKTDFSAVCRAHSLWVDYELSPTAELSIVERTLHICNFCLSREVFAPRFQTCSGCKVIHYCDTECQKKDWKAHRILCSTKTLQALHDQTHAQMQKEAIQKFKEFNSENSTIKKEIDELLLMKGPIVFHAFFRRVEAIKRLLARLEKFSSLHVLVNDSDKEEAEKELQEKGPIYRQELFEKLIKAFLFNQQKELPDSQREFHLLQASNTEELKIKYKNFFWAKVPIAPQQKQPIDPREHYLFVSYTNLNFFKRVIKSTEKRIVYKDTNQQLKLNFPCIRKVLDPYAQKISINFYPSAIIENLERFRASIFEMLTTQTFDPQVLHRNYFLIFIYKSIVSFPCIHLSKQELFIKAVQELNSVDLLHCLDFAPLFEKYSIPHNKSIELDKETIIKAMSNVRLQSSLQEFFQEKTTMDSQLLLSIAFLM